MQSKGYKYAISTKNDGNMSFLWGKAGEVLANRRKFLAGEGFALDSCVAMSLSHSELVTEVGRKDRGRGILQASGAIEADALITNEKDISLFVLVADCAPTIFYDKKKRVLCLAHLNGMNSDLIQAVISKFKGVYLSDVSDITVFMGPSIKQKSHVVPDPFQRKMPEWTNYITNIDEHLTAIDMVGFLREKMIKQGVDLANISISDVDTYEEKDLFSHRRSVVTGEQEGRFAVVAKLTK